MRVSSTILPSFSGTLKSTRTRTRLPCTSPSRTVFFPRAPTRSSAGTPIDLVARAARDRGAAESRIPLGLHGALPRRGDGCSQTFRDERADVGDPAGVAPLVVVPGHGLHHVAEHDRVERREDARVGVTLQIAGDQRLLRVGEDPAQLALGGSL